MLTQLTHPRQPCKCSKCETVVKRGGFFDSSGAFGFLEQYGFILTIDKGAATKRPPWTEPGQQHGQHYVITIERADNPKHQRQFDFWGSIHDKERGETPTAYDVLSCIASDATLSGDPDEIAEEFGPMPPSRAAAIAAAAEAWRGFLTQDEIEALHQIDG